MNKKGVLIHFDEDVYNKIPSPKRRWVMNLVLNELGKRKVTAEGYPIVEYLVVWQGRQKLVMSAMADHAIMVAGWAGRHGVEAWPMESSIAKGRFSPMAVEKTARREKWNAMNPDAREVPEELRFEGEAVMKKAERKGLWDDDEPVAAGKPAVAEAPIDEDEDEDEDLFDV